MRNTQVTMIALAATLSGCGAFKTKNNGQKATQLNEALNGTWQGGCVAANWLDVGHEQEQLTFGALGDYNESTTLFSDSNCTSAMATVTEKGTYSSLGAAADLANTSNINFQATDYTVTPKSDAAVSMMNTAKYCDITNWANGQSVDVTGKSCLGTTYSNGNVTFDVYQISGNHLTLGKSTLFLNESSASSRPTQLDSSNVLTKQ